MKIFIASLILVASLPVNAYESIGDKSNREAYESQAGYANENKCFRYENREQYIPGNTMSPGYVKSYKDKVSIPCKSHPNVFNNSPHKTESKNSYVIYNQVPKCTGSTFLGALIHQPEILVTQKVTCFTFGRLLLLIQELLNGR